MMTLAVPVKKLANPVNVYAGDKAIHSDFEMRQIELRRGKREEKIRNERIVP